LAERTLEEIEIREEWRVAREDRILESLADVKYDTIVQRKSIEKISRKMLRTSMQYEQLPTYTDLNHPEIHLQNIMNGRIGSDSQYVLVSDFKRPTISVGAWKDTISKNVKILEGLLC
jgi:hypothetical protein